MPKVFSFTQLSDGQRVFLGEPHVGESERDDTGYQFFDVYDDEYLENKVGSLGISITGTVSTLWGFSQEDDAHVKLAKVMRLAFPLIDLPITPDEYSSLPSSYFPVVELHSDGDIAYNSQSRRIVMPSGKYPEDFFKSTVFKGRLDEDNVRKLILVHGYLEGLSDGFGDFRFMSLEMTEYMWPIRPVRTIKAFNSLIDDGLLEPMGGKTSSGFPSMSRIPSQTRRLIEALSVTDPETEPNEVAQPPQSPAQPPYISEEIAAKIYDSAKSRGYDMTKLRAILIELNDAYERDKPQSSHALMRALLDHISPLFGFDSFSEVANNYSWSQTDKKRISELNTLFRFDADESLHARISTRNLAVYMDTIGLIRRTINIILEEAANQS